jgi:dolichol-phosphate mannosyltransferase
VKLSVIVAAYNEADTIEESIARVRAVGLDTEIIAVDDCSTDGTREILQRIPGITLLLHERNLGKGMAIRTALQAVTGDIVVIHDADLEYDPQDFPALIEPIIRGEADVVYGSRFLEKRPAMRLPNFIANRLLAITANLVFGSRLTDEATCYKAFRADLIRDLNLTCRRFEFCPEVTAKLLRKGVRIAEVPIRYAARTAELGKKIGWWDGVVAFWTLLKYRIVK